VFEVGIFASRHAGLLAERNLLPLAPMLFVGLAAWLSRRSPRSVLGIAAVLVLVAFPLFAVPVATFVTDFSPPDSFTLIPFVDLLHHSSSGTLELVFYLVAGLALAAALLLPRRLTAVLPAVLLAALAAGSVAASTYVADHATSRRHDFVGDNPRWIDEAARGRTAYVYGGEPDWDVVWHTAFWNRRIDRVYDLPGTHVFGPLPQESVHYGPDGLLVNDAPSTRPPVDYAVASTAFAIQGTLVRHVTEANVAQNGVNLWQIDPPLRLSTLLTGVAPNGDIYPKGRGHLTVYGCGPGRFRLELIIKEPETITILRNGHVYRRLQFARIPPGDHLWDGTVPSLPPPGHAPGTAICSLELRPTGLLGSNVIFFERSK
jgi:hypothetical protein